ncbi:hypothetical protein [Streptomyces exfoliatus]|uniref:hypothetical protein n=1 Tax=Streptomyces exfoliatus TaxID=1905 RepID=UPI000B282008|nr:hypothetical protein [Streptomyces exfoliatus]
MRALIFDGSLVHIRTNGEIRARRRPATVTVTATVTAFAAFTAFAAVTLLTAALTTGCGVDPDHPDLSGRRRPPRTSPPWPRSCTSRAWNRRPSCGRSATRPRTRRTSPSWASGTSTRRRP